MVTGSSANDARSGPEAGAPASGDAVEDHEQILFAVPDVSEADIAAVTAVMRTGWITTGKESQLLEAELAAYLEAEHVVAVSSCTAALEISLAHLGLAPGARGSTNGWSNRRLRTTTGLLAPRGSRRPLDG